MSARPLQPFIPSDLPSPATVPLTLLPVKVLVFVPQRSPRPVLSIMLSGCRTPVTDVRVVLQPPAPTQALMRQSPMWLVHIDEGNLPRKCLSILIDLLNLSQVALRIYIAQPHTVCLCSRGLVARVVVRLK